MQRKRKQYSIEDQLRVLKLGDDYGFSIVLDNNLEGAEFMVRTLTRKEDISIVEARTQVSMRNPFGHSAVLDILAKDSKGGYACIEIQRVFKGWPDTSRRMLHYASLLYSKTLERGSDYANAKDVYVIFIFDDDVFDLQLPLYEFRMRMEDGMDLPGANLTVIVANGAYRDRIETDLSKLFSDLHESDPKKMKVPVLRKAMEQLKGRDGRMRSEFDRMMSSIKKDIREEGKAIGMKEGLAEGRADIARNMIRESFPPERIAQLTGLSQDDVCRIAAEMAEG